MKTAEEILSSYFPEPDDLVSGRVRVILVKAMKEYANQLKPPTMTEEELRKEAEREYPYPNGGSYRTIMVLRETHIKARKMSLPDTSNDGLRELISFIKSEKSEYNECIYLNEEQKATLEAFDFILTKAKELQNK